MDTDEAEGWHGALRRMARVMPQDLRWEMDELFLLYELNGVSDGAAARAVAELYSPPRVTKELERMRRRVPGMSLVPGATFDLQEDEDGVAHDVLKAADRQRIRDRVDRDKPFLVVGSPEWPAGRRA